MQAKLLLAFMLVFLGTGFAVDKSPRAVDLMINQQGQGSPSVIVLNDPGQLYESIEPIEPGKFLVHYKPVSCLYRNGFAISNGGNLVDFPIERDFALGYWVCGQAILTVTDAQGNFANGFTAYATITIYPGSQIVP